MTASWIAASSQRFDKLAGFLSERFSPLGLPHNQRRIKGLLLLLLCLWLLLSITTLVWSLVPRVEQPLPARSEVLNTLEAQPRSASGEVVDIAQLVNWHLFGEADALSEVAQAQSTETEVANEREGIEKGAQETRLQLKLTGIIAASDDGLGYAVIEYERDQQVYAVDDELPVNGRVKLAKVMTDRVVLDNGGTYELLILFEQSELGKQLGQPLSLLSQQGAGDVKTKLKTGEKLVVDKRDDVDARSTAAEIRQRLYSNPQSLTQWVQVSAVREGSQLLGYRVRPGKDAQQFKRLGFEAGDIVIAVNGVAMDNPAGTMQLYQSLRTASEAVFDVRRRGAELTLTIGLDDSG